MKKLIATTLALALTAASLAGCTSGAHTGSNQNAVNADKMSQTQTVKAPKYVFLFIGDGMKLSPDSVYIRLSGRPEGRGLLAGGAQPGRQPGRQAGRPGVPELYEL